jgi:carbonic anhydrase/acetyltransferase-like protein (isoleucine patch superfamily)
MPVWGCTNLPFDAKVAAFTGPGPRPTRYRQRSVKATMIITFNGTTPTIGNNVYIAPTAVVIGDVTIADGASIWFNAVLRADMAPITIGPDTNIQDNCTIHTDTGIPATIGRSVTVGHNAVVHGCTIEDECLVGIGAIVLNKAHLGRRTVVAAGTVVREGDRFGPRQLVAGTPAAVKKRLSDDAAERFAGAAQHYRALSAAYRSQHI